MASSSRSNKRQAISDSEDEIICTYMGNNSNKRQAISNLDDEFKCTYMVNNSNKLQLFDSEDEDTMIAVNKTKYRNLTRLYKIIKDYQLVNYNDISMILKERSYIRLMSAYTDKEIRTAIDHVNKQNIEKSFKMPYRYYMLYRYLECKTTDQDKKMFFATRECYNNYVAAGLKYIEYIIKDPEYNRNNSLFHIFEAVANKKFGDIGCVHLKGKSGKPNTGKNILAKLFTYNTPTHYGHPINYSYLPNIIKARVWHMNDIKITPERVENYINLFSVQNKIQPFVIATSNDSFYSFIHGKQLSELQQKVITFILSTEIDPQYIENLKKKYNINSYDIPLTPIHYVLWLSYIQLRKRYETLDDFINSSSSPINSMWHIIENRNNIDIEQMDDIFGFNGFLRYGYYEYDKDDKMILKVTGYLQESNVY